MQFEVVGEESLKSVEAPTIEDAVENVKDHVSESKIVEIDEIHNRILVIEIVMG